MVDVKGFWSYVQEVDEIENERISNLREDICGQYKIKTGKELDLFQDKEGILWGEHWEERLNTELEETVFFIPIITPQYFDSDRCRKELKHFSTTVEERGLKELVLPILYTDVQELHKDKGDIKDELIRKVKSCQYKDWTELRLESQNSAPYRKGVNELAERLIDIENTVSKKKAAKKKLGFENEELEKIKYLGKVASLRDNMDEWGNTMARMVPNVQEVGQTVEKYKAKLEELMDQNASSSELGVQLKKLSEELKQPAQNILEEGVKYAANLRELDPSINAMFELLKMFSEENLGYEALVQDFFEDIEETYQFSRKLINSAKEYVEDLKSWKEVHSDLHDPIDKIERGVQYIVAAHSLIEDWNDRREEFLQENELSRGTK